ncbi:MAG TPA: HAD hydrolase-like protein [Alphaproteobacteria bacterium]|nr:hypothetical protein [Rhodospirillaceae bacterium]HRJ67843.1 HAD hydrolase-like protein [Alphaproteobacteria bacterium]
MVKAVFFDMDNTLIETQQIYIDAENRFADFMLGCGVHDKPQDIIERLRARQIEIFDRFGYGKELLPQAYEDVLKEYVPDADAHETKRARNLAYDVYATEAKIKPGAPEALAKAAASGFDLYLITVGDPDVQNARVAALPFRHAFREVFVVEDKNVAVYAAALAKVGLKGEDAVMVGDSLKSDIIPARKNGMEAIHVAALNWHGREMAGQTLPDGASAAQNITDAVDDIVARFGKPPANDAKAPAPAHKHGRGFGPR